MGDFDPAVLLDSEMRRLSVKPNMTARDCRLVMAYGAAIEALKATHPQPVTPAGGEVATVCVHDGQNYLKWTDGDYHYLPVGTKLYIHPPVADAALARDAERYRWLRKNAYTGTILTGAAEPLACEEPEDEWDRIIDAALNQRGGG